MDRELLAGGRLPGVLTTARTPRVGVVALHPAGDPSRDFPLLRHLATALPAHGAAVLRFDRRAPRTTDGDVPLRVQAEDALCAIADLRAATSADLPVVLWGFSQGAWVAMLAAHEVHLAGVVVPRLPSSSTASLRFSRRSTWSSSTGNERTHRPT